MIAKIIKGTSFSGVLAYILGKQEGKARILHTEGVRQDALPHEIAKDFALQASMRPTVKNPVCHTILSFSAEDAASITSLPMTAPRPSECNQQAYIEGFGQKLEQQIRHNDEFKEELVSVLTKLGARIHEMKSGIAEVRISQDEAADRLLTELQTKQPSPEVKITKYYLFDAKRWAEWLVWGIMIAVLGCVIGWASHLYGVNQNLESYALRYRTIRMELGYSEPRIAELDSLFSSENSDDSIRRLRSRITNYELAIQRQAELQLKQKQLSEEQEALTQQLQN